MERTGYIYIRNLGNKVGGSRNRGQGADDDAYDS